MICLDTHVFGWGIGKYARVKKKQEYLVDQAERYFEYLQREKIEVMLAAPVLAEYWVDATVQERHEKLIFELSTEVYAFDGKAAVIAADLWKDTRELRALAKDFDIKYDCVKIDIMIASVAIAHGAQKIITNDDGLFKILVKNKIPVGPLPDMPRPKVQQHLHGPNSRTLLYDDDLDDVEQDESSS